METKFKIGDKVKRIKCIAGIHYNDMEVGDIDIVTWVGHNLGLKKYGNGHSLSCFELVNQTLKELIEK